MLLFDVLSLPSRAPSACPGWCSNLGRQKTQCSFRSSADGSIILDTSNARSSRPVSPLASRPFVRCFECCKNRSAFSKQNCSHLCRVPYRSKSTQGQREDTNRTLPFYSSDFEERYYRSYDKFVFFKSPKAGLIPKTKWELRNQVLSACSSTRQNDVVNLSCM
jgi:hypothetical protein